MADEKQGSIDAFKAEFERTKQELSEVKATLAKERAGTAFLAALRQAGVSEAGASDALKLLLQDVQDIEQDEAGAITAKVGGADNAETPEAIAKQFLDGRPHFKQGRDPVISGKPPQSEGQPQVSDTSPTFEPTASEFLDNAGPEPKPPELSSDNKKRTELSPEELERMSPADFFDLAGLDPV